MSTKTHPNSRKITIFRKDTFIMDAQKQAGSEFVSQARKSIGSYFEKSSSAVIGSGLTSEEKRILMPGIVDCDPEDRQFRQKVSDYFASMKTLVPYGTGLTLEIGLEEDNNEPVSASNLPINIPEFLKWRHAQGHPQVALSKKAGEGNQLIEYYIFDAQAVENESVADNEKRDLAIEKYLLVKKQGTGKINQLLTMLGIDPRTFKGTNADKLKLAKLDELARTKSKEFVEAFENKYFEQLYILKSLVNAKLVKKIGSKFVDADDVTQVLGNNEEEAVVWIKSPENSEKLVIYRMRLQENNVDIPAVQKAAGVTQPVKEA